MKFASYQILLVTVLLASYNCNLFQAIKCAFLRASYAIMVATAQTSGQLDSDKVDEMVWTCGAKSAFSLLPANLMGLYQLRKDAVDIINRLFNIKFDFKTTLLEEEKLIFSSNLIDITSKFKVSTSNTVETNKDALIIVNGGVVTSKDGADFKMSNLDDVFANKVKDLTGFNIKDMSINFEQKIAPLDGKFSVKATLAQIDLTYSTSKKNDVTTVNEEFTYAH